jgi:hypothetical protein
VQIGVHILDFVDGDTLLAATAVSRRWRVIADTERVWKALCTRYGTVARQCRPDKSQVYAAVPVHRRSSTQPDDRESKVVYWRHRRIVDNWLRKPLQCSHVRTGEPYARIVRTTLAADVSMRRLVMNNDGNLAYPSETSNEVRVFDSAHTTMQRTLTLSDDTTDNLIWCLVYCVHSTRTLRPTRMVECAYGGSTPRRPYGISAIRHKILSQLYYL